MSILCDREIIERATKHQMITPFEAGNVKERISPALVPVSMQENYQPVKERIISYGTSSYGYDMRIADEFKIFTNINTCIVDPKNFDEKSFVDFKGDSCIIPPNSFLLGRSVEYFKIPRDIMVVCLGKSTYARVGLVCNVTPLESEWEGYVTIEISNTTPCPAKIYANEGIAQLLFFRASEVCKISYKDKKGKYMSQTGITLAKV